MTKPDFRIQVVPRLAKHSQTFQTEEIPRFIYSSALTPPSLVY